MKPNPVLKQLGLRDTDRVDIIDTDDVGMCQASVEAFSDLWEFGLISSGSLMVPCPWFPYAANFCRQSHGIDMGVHITLTSEFDLFRWGPVSINLPNGRLVDSDGCLPN